MVKDRRFFREAAERQLAMTKFRSCPSCRGQAKLTVTIPCPECEGDGSITDRQLIGKLGDMLSPATMDKLAEMLVEDDRDRLEEWR